MARLLTPLEQEQRVHGLMLMVVPLLKETPLTLHWPPPLLPSFQRSKFIRGMERHGIRGFLSHTHTHRVQVSGWWSTYHPPGEQRHRTRRKQRSYVIARYQKTDLYPE